MSAPAACTSELALLHQLEPVVRRNLERHLSLAKEWMPHDYVPWDRGRSFALLGGEDWCLEQSALSPVARASMVLNLLTEDNLPSYHHDIARQFGRDGAWGEWVHRWTAEEGRHASALRDYLVVTRSVDPVDLERRRMAHMSAGYRPDDDRVLPNLAYVTFQELATRVSHRNTGRATGCPVAEQLLTRIATDENLHMVFYRDLADEAFELAPDQMMAAVASQVATFEMPGTGAADFARSAAAIATAGIYDLRLHLDEVVLPVLRFWRVFERDGMSAAGDRSRTELAGVLAGLEARASRFEERRDRLRERRALEQSEPQRTGAGS